MNEECAGVVPADLSTARSADHRTRVIVVIGVAGVGKTTTARALAERLGWDLGEGDDFHPADNVAKMSAGISLTDDDRWSWLDAIAGWIRNQLATGRNGVISCSALKGIYRERLWFPGVTFVHLVAVADTVHDRMSRREGHFMPATLLASQFSALEPLTTHEHGSVVHVDNRTPGEVVDEILEVVSRQQMLPG